MKAEQEKAAASNQVENTVETPTETPDDSSDPTQNETQSGEYELNEYGNPSIPAPLI